MKNGADIQRKILGALSTSGNLSVAQLASTLRAKPHVVRYQLSQLLQENLIRRTVLLDQRALGKQMYNIFFNMALPAHRSVTEFFLKRREISWFAHVNGARKFEVVIVVPHSGHVEKIFKDLARETGAALEDRVLGIDEDLYYWGLRYLADEYRSRGPTVVFKRGDVFEADEIDLKIIRSIRHGGDDSSGGLARSVGIPASSLAYRLAKLRQARVISDDLYVVKRDDLGYSHAALLVTMKVRSREAEEQLINFAQEHPNVAGCIAAVGNWDYKLLVYGDSYADVMRTEDQLLSKLARLVSSSSIYLRRQILKSEAGV